MGANGKKPEEKDLVQLSILDRAGYVALAQGVGVKKEQLAKVLELADKVRREVDAIQRDFEQAWKDIVAKYGLPEGAKSDDYKFRADRVLEPLEKPVQTSGQEGEAPEGQEE